MLVRQGHVWLYSPCALYEETHSLDLQQLLGSQYVLGIG
jgi:hypothetical protein